MSLAASMGDPDVGQLQDVLVHPVDPEDHVEEGSAEELHDLFQDGHPLRIVDGETRRLAAEKLGWATLDATIVPEPPDSTVVAQLDANTERIDMTQAETVRALYQHYQETDLTLEEIGDKVGFSRSYLSNVFSLMEGPEWLQEAWRHPEHPLETSHALAVNSMLSSNSLEEYAQAGGLDEQAAFERAVEDAQLMIDVQGEHDLQVGEFRKRVKRCRKETLDQLRDQRSLEEKRADGQTAEAEREASPGVGHEPPEETCMVCGDPGDRKIAIDVCKEDYGMLSEMKANGDVLMAQASSPSPEPELKGEANGDREAAAEALAAVAGVPTEQALHVVEEVQQQATQAGEPGG